MPDLGSTRYITSDHSESGSGEEAVLASELGMGGGGPSPWGVTHTSYVNHKWQSPTPIFMIDIHSLVKITVIRYS